MADTNVLTVPTRASATEAALHAVCVACGDVLGHPHRLGAGCLAGCGRCGTRSGVPRPTAEELRTLHDSPSYFDKQYFGARRDAQADTRRRLARVQAHARQIRGESFLPGRRMLDVGCDTGDFVLAAQAEAGIEPFGVDVSTRAVETAARRGVKVSATELEDAPADFTDFALVTAIDVIEHVAEPGGLLESIGSRLARDGLVYLETPNWRSAVYRVGERLARIGEGRPRRVFERLFPPEHVQYFTLPGIHALVDRSPLRPLHVTTRPLAFGAVAGGYGLRAGTWLAQLPDRGSDRQILICALLCHRDEPSD